MHRVGCKRLPRRGGNRNNGANAGLAALIVNNDRANRNVNIGFRPALGELSEGVLICRVLGALDAHKHANINVNTSTGRVMLKAFRCGETFDVLVDNEDLAYFKKVALRVTERGYVVCSQDGRDKRIHRLIMDAPNGRLVDHINGDPLDNRRCNLRLCSHAENMRNRRIRQGKAKGVVWLAHKRKWHAQIKIDGHKYHLGDYFDKAEAIRTYDAIARQYHGEFARTNHAGTEKMTLDDVRNNWRSRATPSSSPYIGVSKTPDGWQASLTKNGKKVWRKRGQDPAKLAHLRDEQAIKHLGSSAKLNFNNHPFARGES